MAAFRGATEAEGAAGWGTSTGPLERWVETTGSGCLSGAGAGNEMPTDARSVRRQRLTSRIRGIYPPRRRLVSLKGYLLNASGSGLLKG